MAACTPTENNEITYTNAAYKVTNGRMSPETLWAFGTVSMADISPDKSKVLYTVSWTDVAENKSHKEVFVMNTDGSDKTQLTFDNDNNENNVLWRPDGKKIGFIKSGQLWEMNPDGSALKQISDIEGDITGFRYAPDQKNIMYTKMVTLQPEIRTPYADMPKANVRKVHNLMYRHWDHYVDGEFSHIFVTPYGDKVSAGTDIMEGELWEAPMRPFSGIEDIVWHPNGQELIYACRKKIGKDYAFSTNSDLYCYNLATAKTTNLTEGMMGYDKAPVFSNDGEIMVWESMERDGYEADVVRLAKMDWNSKKISFYNNDDMNPSGFSFDAKDENIYFTSVWHARYNIYKYNIAKDEVTQVTDEDANYGSVACANDILIATRQAHAYPTEIFAVSKEDGTAKNISNINKPILDQITMGETQEHWIETTDGKQMLVWLILPIHILMLTKNTQHYSTAKEDHSPQ